MRAGGDELEMASLPPIDLGGLRTALRRMRPRAGRDADQLRPTDIECLLDGAFADLLEFIEVCG